jgi:flagellar FliL protein
MVVIALAVVLLFVAAAGGLMIFKSRVAHADDEDEVEVEVAPQHKKGAHQAEAFDPKHMPVFVPLDAITINLADRDIDRYAQVVIALEVDDDKAGEQIKAFMPVIRSNLLLAIAKKTSEDVRSDDGRRRLAAELQAQALRPLGYDFDAEDFMDSGGEAKSGKHKRKTPAKLPVKAVHFINFIVQ